MGYIYIGKFRTRSNNSMEFMVPKSFVKDDNFLVNNQMYLVKVLGTTERFKCYNKTREKDKNVYSKISYPMNLIFTTKAVMDTENNFVFLVPIVMARDLNYRNDFVIEICDKVKHVSDSYNRIFINV